jgi:serine protease Do
LVKPKCVFFEKVFEGGAALKTDIKEGDVILKVDDHEVNLPNELQSYIASKPAGSQVTLLLFRDGKEITRQITLQAREGTTTKNVSEKDSKGNEKDESNLNSATFDNIGLTVRNLTKDEKSQFNIDGGVIITDVKPFSPAADKGLGEGLVIVKADKKDINNVSELKKIVDSKKGSAVLFLVKDDKGNNRYVGLDVPNK